MMRWTLLCFILGFCHLKTAAEDNAFHPMFQDNTVYIYNYTGEIRTGRDDALAPHFSGFALQSRLQVFTRRDGYVQFTLTDIKIGREHKEATCLDLRFAFSRPQTPEEKEWMSKVEQPFVAWYHGGLFKSFFNPTSEEANFRKSIVSLFQLSLSPTSDYSENYTIVEDSLFGVCSSLYHRSSNTEVVKIRSYETCENRPYFFFSSLMGYQCHLSVQQEIEPLTVFDRTQFSFAEVSDAHPLGLLKKITGESVVRLTPFTNRGQSFVSDVRQEVALIDFKKDCNTCKEADLLNFQRVTSLGFKFDQDYSQSHLSKQAHRPQMTNRMIVSSLTSELSYLLEALPLKLITTGNISESVFRMLELFRQLDYVDIVDFYKNYVPLTKNSSQEIKTNWFLLLEMLPFIGTRSSTIYMVHDLIEENKIDNQRANKLLSKFAYHVKEPTYPLFQYILNFTKSTLQKSHYKSKLWRAAWLSIGNLVHRGCLNTFFNPLQSGQPFMSSEECDNCFKILVGEFKNRESGLGIEYLKAIGNTMVPKAFNFFVDLAMTGRPPKKAQNDSEANEEGNSHLRIRSVAIAGMIPFMHPKPEEIASIMYEIFHNEDEDDVIRIHAFDVLIWSRPTRDNFFHLIPIVNYPSNFRISSYVYNTVYTFAKSKDPARQRLVRLSKQILPLLKPPKEFDSLTNSQDRIFTAYNGRYNFGHANQFFMIPSQESIIPREVYFHESLNFMNHKFDIIELGYIAEGEAPFQKYANIFLPKALTPTTFNDTPTLRKMTSGFEWYMKSFSHDVLFDEEFDSATPDDTRFFNLHNLLYNEVEFSVPNAMGFPVVTSLKLFTSTHFMGNKTILPRAGGSSVVDVNSKFSMNIALKSKLYVHGISSEEYGYEVGTVSVLKFPLHSTVYINSNNHMINFNYKLLMDAYDLFQFETIPGVLFPVPPYKFSSKLLKSPIIKKVEIGRDYFGVGLNLHIASNQNDHHGFLSGLFEAVHETANAKVAENDTLSDHYYAAIRGLLGYAFFNPRAKPFQFVVTVVPSTKYPTKEFQIEIQTQTETFADLQVSEEDRVAWKRSTVQIAVNASGIVDRQWNIDFNKTSCLPNERNLEDYISHSTTRVPHNRPEAFKNSPPLAFTMDHHNVFFRHTFNSTGMEDSFDILSHVNHTLSMASNFSYFIPAADITTFTKYGLIEYDKLYLPHEKIASLVQETNRWLWKKAYANFYSECVVTSTIVTTFDGHVYSPQLSSSAEKFHIVFDDCFNQDIRIEYRNGSLNAELQIKYNADDQLQKLEIFFTSSGLHIIFNGIPMHNEEPLPTVQPWTNAFHREKIILAVHSNRIYIEPVGFELLIIFDKNFLLITASNGYRGRLCGICGNMNGEPYSQPETWENEEQSHKLTFHF